MIRIGTLVHTDPCELIARTRTFKFTYILMLIIKLATHTQTATTIEKRAVENISPTFYNIQHMNTIEQCYDVLDTWCMLSRFCNCSRWWWWCGGALLIFTTLRIRK